MLSEELLLVIIRMGKFQLQVGGDQDEKKKEVPRTFYTTKIASQRVSELCSQSFSEFLANQSEDNSVYMSFQSALFHIEARKGIFNSNSQALRA